MTVGAIRSTGLSASRAIAEYATELVFGPCAGHVKADVVMPRPRKSKDGGNSLIVGKYEFEPTHPLSSLAWQDKA